MLLLETNLRWQLATAGGVQWIMENLVVADIVIVLADLDGGLESTRAVSKRREKRVEVVTKQGKKCRCRKRRRLLGRT
ncbi:hypothetical protein GYH30_043659 [Glycine max]|nr:hypothetical protein GYH30_043659 [Glycine max]